MTVVERPALDGARVVKDAAFDGYVRSGATVEMKAFTGVTGDAGGYAVPREIDAVIDATLKAASPRGGCRSPRWRGCSGTACTSRPRG